MINKLEMTEQGLLIPPDWLRGLPGKMRIRRIKGGLLLETDMQFEKREQLKRMVQQLRNAPDAPSEGEVADIVEAVRAERAGRD
jgi:hypothetical protein